MEALAQQVLNNVYSAAMAKIILFNDEDIIKTSNSISDKPGHGWGDKNHNHSGPPGQNKK